MPKRRNTTKLVRFRTRCKELRRAVDIWFDQTCTVRFAVGFLAIACSLSLIFHVFLMLVFSEFVSITPGLIANVVLLVTLLPVIMPRLLWIESLRRKIAWLVDRPLPTYLVGFKWSCVYLVTAFIIDFSQYAVSPTIGAPPMFVLSFVVGGGFVVAGLFVFLELLPRSLDAFSAAMVGLLVFPNFDRFWDLFGFLLPTELRRRIYTPTIEEMRIDYHYARKRYRTKWARRWIIFCFFFRTFLVIAQCLKALAADAAFGWIVRLIRR